jgi:ABC-type cobalamin/Fe3+-siderophores transport system ATPase subunit
MSAISVEDLVVVRGGRRVLDGISFQVEPGEHIALVGPNGAGKTTLIRAILGLVRIHRGNIALEGAAHHRMSPLARAEKIAWLPQHALAEEAISVVEFVQVARFRFRESKQSARQAALRALRRVGAERWALRLVTQLSGGEQQRVALAALLAQESHVILADEPGNHLDPAQQMTVWQLLGQCVQHGTMIVVTHDVNWLSWLGPLSSTRIVALEGGRLAFDVLANDEELPHRLSELYGIRMRSFASPEQWVIAPFAASERPT